MPKGKELSSNNIYFIIPLRPINLMGSWIHKFVYSWSWMSSCCAFC